MVDLSKFAAQMADFKVENFDKFLSAAEGMSRAEYDDLKLKDPGKFAALEAKIEAAYEAFAKEQWETFLSQGTREQDLEKEKHDETDPNFADLTAEKDKKLKDIEDERTTANIDPNSNADTNTNEDDDWHKEYIQKYSFLSKQKNYQIDTDSNTNGLDINLKRTGETEPFMKAQFKDKNKVGLEITDLEGARAAVREFKHLGFDKVNVSDKFSPEVKAWMMIAAIENDSEFYVDRKGVKFEDLGITDPAIKKQYEDALKTRDDARAASQKIEELRGRTSSASESNKQNLGNSLSALKAKAEGLMKSADPATDTEKAEFDKIKAEMLAGTADEKREGELIERHEELLLNKLDPKEKEEFLKGSKEYKSAEKDITQRESGRDLRKRQSELVTEGTTLIPAGSPEETKLKQVEAEMAKLNAIREGKVPDPSDSTGTKMLPAANFNNQEMELYQGFANERKKLGLDALEKGAPDKFKEYNDNKNTLKERGKGVNQFQQQAQGRY